jgi:hypothetical protein
VDQVVEPVQPLGDHVDTPQTIFRSGQSLPGIAILLANDKLTQCRCSWWRSS